MLRSTQRLPGSCRTEFWTVPIIIPTHYAPSVSRGKKVWAPRRDAVCCASTPTASQVESAAATVAPSAAATVSAPRAPALAAEGESGAFVWTRNWFPALAATVETDRPHAVTILGQALVLWRDGSGVWRCFDDTCPHRLVPLSEGRVESDGTLMCSYHGWRFNGEGRCMQIPQCVDSKAQAVACSSRRSRVQSYPTQEVAGLVWVWPDAATDAFVEAFATEVKLPQELQVVEKTLGWYWRDLPYSYEILVENLIDPSHVPFAHHRVMGPFIDRYRPLIPDLRMEHTTERGDMTAAYKDGTGIVRFCAPSFIGYKHMLLLTVPTVPGHSRAFLAYPLFGEYNAFVSFFTGLPKFAIPWMPEWALRAAYHVSRHDIFDGDSVFLRYQDQVLRRRGHSWKQLYYLPSTCDAFVVAVREWMDRVAGGGPQYAEGTPDNALTEEVGREQLLSRWEQHTRTCPDCKKAMQQLDRLQVALRSVAAVAGISTAAVVGAGGPWVGGAGALLLGLGALLADARIQKLLPYFQFKDYVHADMD